MNTQPITSDRLQDAIIERIQQRALQVALHMQEGMSREDAESICGESVINMAKFPIYEEAIAAHLSWDGYQQAKSARREDIREGFNQAISKTNDPDTVAKLEVCREYFTNPDFRAKLEQFTWEVNN